jgi:hypothetical protein
MSTRTEDNKQQTQEQQQENEEVPHPPTKKSNDKYKENNKNISLSEIMSKQGALSMENDALSTENDGHHNTLTSSLSQMRLQNVVPAPPANHAPTMPSRGGVPSSPRECSRSRKMMIAGRSGSCGSLTFAISVNALPRAGSSRRLVAEEELLGRSISTLESCNDIFVDHTPSDFGGSLSSIGLSYVIMPPPQSEQEDEGRASRRSRRATISY